MVGLKINLFLVPKYMNKLHSLKSVLSAVAKTRKRIIALKASNTVDLLNCIYAEKLKPGCLKNYLSS